VVNRRPNPPPRRVPNRTLRSREYLTQEEVSDLIKAAGGVGRNRLRDATLILVSYRHGRRVSEANDLRWEQVELKRRLLHVRRIKNGSPSARSATRSCRRSDFGVFGRIRGNACHLYVLRYRNPNVLSRAWDSARPCAYWRFGSKLEPCADRRPSREDRPPRLRSSKWQQLFQL
jgi:hypothetical protein